MKIINLMHWGEPLGTLLCHPWGKHWVKLGGNLGVSLGSKLAGYRWGNLGETLGAN